MAGRQIEVGAVGRRVAANIADARSGWDHWTGLKTGMTLTELSKKLREIGRPISPNSLARIELGERRVDVDDLLALASALDTNVIALLALTAEDREKNRTELDLIPLFGRIEGDDEIYDKRIRGETPDPRDSQLDRVSAGVRASVGAEGPEVTMPLRELEAVMTRAAIVARDEALAVVDRRLSETVRELYEARDALKREVAKREGGDLP